MCFHSSHEETEAQGGVGEGTSGPSGEWSGLPFHPTLVGSSPEPQLSPIWKSMVIIFIQSAGVSILGEAGMPKVPIGRS